LGEGGKTVNAADEIRRRAEALPAPLQAEVLDFIDYLAMKARRENEAWEALSVESALRGMETEEWPDLPLREQWR
jgi:hypothetical protein